MNHTLTESSFEDPCTRQTNAQGIDTGIDSAFNFATQSADGKNQPVFAFSVEDDKTPQWFYCRQTAPVSHCNDGMVVSSHPCPRYFLYLAQADHMLLGSLQFAINPPPEGNTFDKFQKKAQALGKKGKKYEDKYGKKDYQDEQKKYDEGKWDEDKYGYKKYEKDQRA
jgi:hypothetical protein